MARRLLNLLTALSLLLSVAVVGLWVRSYRNRSAVEFDRRGERWQIASEAGSIRMDNEPQRRREADATARERAGLMAECVRLSRELESLRQRLSRAAVGDKQGIEVEIARVRALGVTNQNERASSLAKPASTTPPEGYAAPHLAVAGAAVLPAAVWLALAALRARSRRFRRSNDLCESCGYDLRATPDQCPECGTPGSVSVGV